MTYATYQQFLILNYFLYFYTKEQPNKATPLLFSLYVASSFSVQHKNISLSFLFFFLIF